MICENPLTVEIVCSRFWPQSSECGDAILAGSSSCSMNHVGCFSCSVLFSALQVFCSLASTNSSCQLLSPSSHRRCCSRRRLLLRHCRTKTEDCLRPDSHKARVCLNSFRAGLFASDSRRHARSPSFISHPYPHLSLVRPIAS